MKNAVVIVFLLGVVYTVAPAQFVKKISGQARYQYQYQRTSQHGIVASGGSHAPMFDIGTSGSIYDPTVFQYTLRTSITTNFSSFGALGNDISAQQYSWNFYNLSGGGLAKFYLVPNFSLSDGITDMRTNSSRYDDNRFRVRRQDRSLRIATRNIPNVPFTTFSWAWARQWSLEDLYPDDQTSTSLGFTTATGGANGALNLSGSIANTEEITSNARQRLYMLTLQGNRILGEHRELDYTVDYNRFENATHITGSGTYTNAEDTAYHTATNMSVRSNSGPFFQSRGINAGQSFNIVANEHFRYSASVHGNYGTDFSRGATFQQRFQTMGTSVSTSVSHMRSIGEIGFSNGISLGYGLQRYRDVSHTYSTSFSNSASAQWLGVKTTINHGLSLNILRDGRNMNTVGNTAGLSMEGSLFNRMETRLTTNYRSTVYSGDLSGYRNQRSINVHWNTRGNFVYYIPFTVGLNGSANWVLLGYRVRTYQWGISFATPHFFVRGLNITYNLSRAFDISYNRASISHNLETRYQWRAVAIEFKLQNYHLQYDKTQYWVSLIRPF